MHSHDTHSLCTHVTSEPRKALTRTQTATVGVLRRFQGTVQSPLLRTVLCDGSNTNLHYPFQTLVDGVGVRGGQAKPWQFRGRLVAPGRKAQPPVLLRE